MLAIFLSPGLAAATIVIGSAVGGTPRSVSLLRHVEPVAMVMLRCTEYAA
jgi:hypothetical protein